MYSAAINHSSYVADKPRFKRTGLFNLPTSFKSDYDILVINSAWGYEKIENKLVSVRNIYDKRGDHRYRVPVQFIHDSIRK